MAKWLIDVEWPAIGRDPDYQYEVIGTVEAETADEALSQVRVSVHRHVVEEPTENEVEARR